MRHVFATVAVSAFALVAILTVVSRSHATRPDRTGGGGSGPSKPYRLVDLGGFVGGDFVQAEASDVNNPDESGVMQVVGYSYVFPTPGLSLADAALWDVTTEGQVLDLSDIGTATEEHLDARKVNDLGFVLIRDRLWVPDAGFVTLPGLGELSGIPRLMDDQGNVFGGAVDGDGLEHAVAWQVNADGTVAGPVDLGDLSGFIWTDVNNHGVFAGRVGNAPSEAAIGWFDEAGEFQLRVLGTVYPDSQAGAVCINDNGMVAGDDRLDGLTEGFVWTAETGMVSLGSMNGVGSRVKDINNLGQIVGWSRSSGQYPQVAFVWQEGQMFDLNEISDGAGGKTWIQGANGINDAGHIVGLLDLGKPVSENHAFLLVPNADQ